MVTQRTVRQVRKVMLWSLVVVLGALALYTLFATWRVFGTLSRVRAERVEAERSRDALVARNTELKAALGALGTARGVESEIRGRYPMGKPGEVEFVFVDKRATSSVDTASTTRESVWSSFRTWIGL